MMQRKSPGRLVAFRILVPLGLLGVGVLIAVSVARLAPSAARAEPTRQIPVVEVIEVEPRQVLARVDATGTVTAAQKMAITPEVAGRITARSESLMPGGRLSEDEVILRLDARDYRFAVDQERARVTAAELDLETEKGRGQVSRREWAAYGDGRSLQQLPLVSREPHLQVASTNLSAARSGLQRAKLNLSRTVIRAPWNAVVLDAQAEVGQVVGPGSKVATLVGTDRVWVRVAVPVQRLTDLNLPGSGADQGARVRVFHDLGDGRVTEWVGQVIRLEGQLEPETRNAQVLIAVEDPFDPPEGALPLLPGSFVSVELEGREVSGVYALPRSVVHEGTRVWVVNGEDRLETRRVEVRWGTDDEVYLTGELRAGDRVVTSALALPLVGERVRVRDDDGDRPRS